jgi:hypothetical protein
MILANVVAAGALYLASQQCKNPLAQTLSIVGFHGENLKEAWAISMRESGGHPREISSTHDYGLFQFNYSAHHKAAWWDSRQLLTPGYNAAIAYRVSQGGKTWRAWGITGNGTRVAGTYAPVSTFLKFKEWLGKFPKACGSL